MAAPNQNTGSGAQAMYDDNEGLHPDDVLITKWFPECTTLELLDRRPERSDMLFEARRAERGIANGINRVPPQVPWPKPPPRPRCELEAGIEEWRRPRLHMMDQFMTKWRTVDTGHARVHETHAAEAASKSLQSTYQHTGKAHRALHLPELLEMVVSLLDPDSMLTIRAVSSALRATVAVVLKSQYRKNYPCSPIEYNERIPAGLNWMQPAESQIAELELDIRNRSMPGFRPNRRFVYTAQVLQAQCLSPATCIAARNIWNSRHQQTDWIPVLPLDASDNRWLDLSQMKVNPYLSKCFGDRMQEQDGKLEIKLLSGLMPLTRSPFATVEPLRSVVRPMFATQPPTKSLGIYAYQSALRTEDIGLRRLELIEAEDGVRIGQLIDALEQHATPVIESWLEDVAFHRDWLAKEEWRHFSLDRSNFRHDWMQYCEVAPKILVLFDGLRPQSHLVCLADVLNAMSFGNGARPEAKDWREAFAQWSEEQPDTEV